MASLFDQAVAWEEALPLYQRVLEAGAGDEVLMAVAKARVEALTGRGGAEVRSGL